MQPGEVYGFSSKELIAMFGHAGFQLLAQERFMLGLNCVYVFGLAEAAAPEVTRLEHSELAHVS
jgi:hypothetical protein